MGYDILIDGHYASYLATASGWDDAANYIEAHTPRRTPLRRLAEVRETYQPQQAADMLADLLRDSQPSANIAHTLYVLQRLLKGEHVVIASGVTAEP